MADEPSIVTYERAGELLAKEGAGGALIPLSRSAIAAAVKRGDLEAWGVGRGRGITRRSINAYLRGEHGRWRNVHRRTAPVDTPHRRLPPLANLRLGVLKIRTQD